MEYLIWVYQWGVPAIASALISCFILIIVIVGLAMPTAYQTNIANRQSRKVGLFFSRMEVALSQLTTEKELDYWIRYYNRIHGKLTHYTLSWTLKERIKLIGFIKATEFRLERDNTLGKHISELTIDQLRDDYMQTIQTIRRELKADNGTEKIIALIDMKTSDLFRPKED